MTSTLLFDRAYQLVLDNTGSGGGTGIDVTGLHFAFHVKRTLLPKPNTAKIEVYNLSDASRNALSTTSTVRVSLKVGYGTTLSEIFRGEVHAAWNTVDNADFVTHLETGDSFLEIQSTTINTSFPAGKKPSDILKALAQAFISKGVGAGNLQQGIAYIANLAPFNKDGETFYGNAAENMTRFCDSVGLTWSIESGRFQFTQYGQPLPQSSVKAFTLSPESGLIGSPESDFKNKQKIVKAKVLITPGLAPGVAINLQSRLCQGLYFIRDIEWRGETFGKDWYCELVMRKAGTQ